MKILKLSEDDFLRPMRGRILFSHKAYVEDIEILQGIVQVNLKWKVKQFSIDKIEWLERPKSIETYIRRVMEVDSCFDDDDDLEYFENKMDQVFKEVKQNGPRSIGALSIQIRDSSMAPAAAQHIVEMAVETKDLRIEDDSTVFME